MKHVPLGHSGIDVSRLGFGCMGLAEFYGPGLDAAGADRVLEAAFARGITFFDTADMYGSGQNEVQLAPFIKRRRGQVVVATKFAIRRAPDGEWLGLSNDPAYIREACEASLRRLNVETIDLYYMHRRDPEVPIEDSVGTMAGLVKAGKVRAIGLSEVSVETLRRAHAVHPIAALQSEYSIITRDMEADIIPACRELGIAFVAYSPLGRGLLTGAYRRPEDFGAGDYRAVASPRFAPEALAQNVSLVDEIARIARRHNATPGQIALAWVMAKGDDIIPIPGTKRLERLEENVAALALALSPQDIAAIEAAVPQDKVVGARYPEFSAASLNR
jgi:aryl-alcohol dehydrogenase-like predicted oxidoreductase